MCRTCVLKCAILRVAALAVRSAFVIPDGSGEAVHQDPLFEYGSVPGKRCSGCRALLPLDAFNRRSKSSDGRQGYCRECNRGWHARNREHHNRMIHARNKRIRRESADRLLRYLMDHPCVDCGETDPVVLEFDHLRDKQRDVSYMAGGAGMPWERILAEIEKCEVVCSNCHRRRTAMRRLSYRYRVTRGLLPAD